MNTSINMNLIKDQKFRILDKFLFVCLNKLKKTPFKDG